MKRVRAWSSNEMPFRKWFELMPEARYLIGWLRAPILRQQFGNFWARWGRYWVSSILKGHVMVTGDLRKNLKFSLVSAMKSSLMCYVPLDKSFKPFKNYSKSFQKRHNFEKFRSHLKYFIFLRLELILIILFNLKSWVKSVFW